MQKQRIPEYFSLKKNIDKRRIVGNVAEKKEIADELAKSVRLDVVKEEIAGRERNLGFAQRRINEIRKSLGLPISNEISPSVKNEQALIEKLNQIKAAIEAETREVNGFEEPAAEKSFWKETESIDEKVKKVEELFNNLNTEELQREDIETHARGWTVTKNIEEIERFKKDIISTLVTGKTSLVAAPCFRQLISQKSYQDIIWVACSIDPKIFSRWQANLKLNAFIQERPEFLESKEFRSVCLEHIKDGIKEGHIFEGYKHNQDFENKISGNSKIDYFRERDDRNIAKSKKDTSDKEPKIKVKRKDIPNNEIKELRVNLDLYKFDSSKIDSLEEEEKDELRKVFLKKIKDHTFYNYSSDRIFGDEIISVGKKLGFTEDELNKEIFDSMLRGVLNMHPPKNGIDMEFPEVYKKIQEALLIPEKRQKLLELICDNIRSTDADFHSWKDSLDYANLSKEELSRVREAYLDFSSGDILKSKQRVIFGYSWEKEEDFPFSKEERLKAFETMNPNQRSCVIATYAGSIEKVDFLPFTQNDILEFAVNSIESPRHAFSHDIEQAQKRIEKNFPNITISNAEIVKKLAFRNLESLGDLGEFLARHSIEMSPKEIVDEFTSAEDFVLKQIRGAELGKLRKLEEFKNNPDTPQLPYLPDELFAEIKQRILKQKEDSRSNYKHDLKELISFVPKRYNFELWANQDLQEAFSDYYIKALRENDLEFMHELGFLIPNNESLHSAEQKVFEEYLKEKNYFSLIGYHDILLKSGRYSPIIGKIEELFKERVASYGLDAAELPLVDYMLKETLQNIAAKKLNELSPNNLQDDELIKEWLNIGYGTGSEKMAIAYGLIKNTKDFSYFNSEIKEYLFRGVTSDKFIGTLQYSSENKPEDIDRAVEFIKDVCEIFDSRFIEDNYDYLYQKLSKLDSEEYAKNVNLLAEMKPLLSFPLISKINFDNLFTDVSSYDEQDKKKFFELIDTASYKINPENDLGWAKNIILYVNETEEHGIIQRDQNTKDKMVDLFSGDYKNAALREMTTEWKNFLQSDASFLSPQIRLVSKIIDEAGGAGNMKHIESLGNLISQVQITLDNKKTTNGTVQEIKGMLLVLESRFSKEKWSQDDISEFYNLSRDILEAAPSLYVVLGSIFENIQSSKDMRKFMSDIFPFYQTQLVIKQNINGDNITYNPRDLVEMRSSIKEFADKLVQGQAEKSSLFEAEKLRLLEIAKDGFRNRFGLLKVPDNFTKENLRSVQNTIRYMGNIIERNPERESLISLYLGLELDNKWSDFRGGKEINFNEYISEKQLQTIKPLLEEKQKSYELVSEVAGVSMDKMAEFQGLLQDDVSNNLIGDIQTIDVKLGNVKRNIDELVDPDVYQTQKEKDVLSIFSAEGRKVNTVLSKLYGISTGKNIQLSAAENMIKSKIESIFAVREWTPGKVKEIQDAVQPIGLVTSMVDIMQEEKVEENIIELQNKLIPNGQIIEIFNKLGEEFHQESGALALAKDLSYLENIIVKDENKITNEEKEIIKDYIGTIRSKMIDMEAVLDHIKQYFEKIKKSSHVDNNPILKSRLAEIEKVIYSQDTSSVITSHMTKDLNLIIENMRQCLGCMRKEANNDTNLAFGDYNKFFMMNQSEKEKGSISDEIIFFVPIAESNGSREMSFVMDKVYGSKSPDVLIGNIVTIYKKYSFLKKKFPDAKLSISVTSSAMNSVGVNSDILEGRLKEVLSDKIRIETFEELNAFIPKSSLSDNYVEFGKNSSARQSGERQFSGLVLR